jgi:AcrR family transcriptional regulator
MKRRPSDTSGAPPVLPAASLAADSAASAGRQPSPGRGRPRSQETRPAVLAAATALLEEGGLPLVTIEAVSARSGVGKPTIYRYWPNRLAVAIDAFAARMADQVPPADLGDARSDLTEQVRRVAAFYASDAGTILAQLLGATAADPAAARQLRDRFLAGRWAETKVMWQRAVARGQARADIPPEVAIDVLFSPIVYRLLVGHAPIDPPSAAMIADAALGGLLVASPSVDGTS